ncbi:MAG: HD domain-containing protein [Candidatus Dadabacteria bacterium]|nr:MAG: HD domain-containing protein [Candidatus Dadabacteria bacterium]
MEALRDGHPPVPTPGEQERLLDEWGVPPHIRRHSRQVARVARVLGGWLRRFGEEPLDLALLDAAAVLHDVAKARCFGSLQDHAREGAEILREAGYEAVADLVGQHVELASFDLEGPVGEAEVLNYSDKRVRHEEVVSLAERFEDLIHRYAKGNAEAEARIRANWDRTRRLEEKLFRSLPFTPDDLTRAVRDSDSEG